MNWRESRLILGWLFWFALILIGSVVSYFEGYWALVWKSDPTGISIFIFALFWLLLLWNLKNTIFIDREIRKARRIEKLLKINPQLLTHPWIRNQRTAGVCSEHIDNLVDIARVRGGKFPDQGNLLEALCVKLEISERITSYGIETLLALGFLGTLVGFIRMMGKSGLGQVLLKSGGGGLIKALEQVLFGLGTAFYTTLVGLICAILLGVLHLLVQNSTTRLTAVIAELVEKYVVPRDLK